MKTYQDFLAEQNNITRFIAAAINEYRASEEYRIALLADEYERQKNVTIRQYVKYLYDATGQRVVDYTSANNKIASNFFHRLNTQRCAYSLGNGVSFNTKATKEKLGSDFDSRLYSAAYYALIHKVSYLFWNVDRAYVFPMTQFCPLIDEEDGVLKAGIRFWSLDWNEKPVTAVLFTEDGFTKYRTKEGSSGLDLVEIQKHRAYKVKVARNEADGEFIVGEDNYSSLPIVPLYGSKHRQSTLVGLREAIDSYDLIQSGFANDLEECAEIYWIISNAMGMSDNDIARFRDKMKLQHIVAADTDNSDVKSYTREVPTNARETFLTSIRSQMYEDFGALDVHTVAAGATNDHIDAAYQTMDEEADDFEYQIIECVQQILKLMNIDDVPQFKRNKISNQKEQVEMLMLAANYLDEETVLKKLPFVTIDEVREILKKRDEEEAERRSDHGGITHVRRRNSIHRRASGVLGIEIRAYLQTSSRRDHREA